MTKHTTSREKGSVLIYIFIAIIALATLVFAVTRGNQGSVSTVDRERADLLATQILDYTGMLRRSIQSMTVDGISPARLCFGSPNWGAGATYSSASNCNNESHTVFSISGGGSTWQDMTQDIFDPTFATTGAPVYGTWVFSGANAIREVGSDCTTAGDAECNELLMILPYIRQNICLALNKRLDIGETIPVGNSDFVLTQSFNGFTNGEELDDALLRGKRSGCFRRGAGGAYTFFAVLTAR